MNTVINQVLAKLQILLVIIKKYHITIFAVFFLSIYCFLVYRIDTLVQSEPDAATISERLNSIQRLKIDQSSIDKILELEEQNIEVKSLFQQARDNPFTE